MTLVLLGIDHGRGKSALSSMKLSRDDRTSIEPLFGELFLAPHPTAPTQIILDLAPRRSTARRSERELHRRLLRYVTHLRRRRLPNMRLLAATLRGPNIDTEAHAIEQITSIVRQVVRPWLHMRILLRAGSAFWHRAPIHRREANPINFVFGVDAESAAAEIKLTATAQVRPVGFTTFTSCTPSNWAAGSRSYASPPA